MIDYTTHTLDVIKPEMNVLISYDYNMGQGSGSAGTNSITGKVRSISATNLILTLTAGELQKKTKKYQVKYKKEGFSVPIRDIRSIVILKEL